MLIVHKFMMTYIIQKPNIILNKNIYFSHFKFRCRSAFKLLQIDDKFSILKPGQCVIDIGAAPGSWSQVAASRINSNSISKFCFWGGT